MKNLSQILMYTLLSIVTLALLFPATRMMFDSAITFWPGIYSDITLGILTLHREMTELSHALFHIFFAFMRDLPWPIWTLFIIYFLATKKETKTSPRQLRQWYEKWNGILWPIYLFTLCIWTAGQSPDTNLVAIFLTITSALLYGTYLAYRIAKKGESFWF